MKDGWTDGQIDRQTDGRTDLSYLDYSALQQAMLTRCKKFWTLLERKRWPKRASTCPRTPYRYSVPVYNKSHT